MSNTKQTILDKLSDLTLAKANQKLPTKNVVKIHNYRNNNDLSTRISSMIYSKNYENKLNITKSINQDKAKKEQSMNFDIQQYIKHPNIQIKSKKIQSSKKRITNNVIREQKSFNNKQLPNNVKKNKSSKTKKKSFTQLNTLVNNFMITNKIIANDIIKPYSSSFNKQNIAIVQSDVPLTIQNTTVKISQLPPKNSIAENDQLVFVNTNNILTTSKITFKNLVDSMEIDGGEI